VKKLKLKKDNDKILNDTGALSPWGYQTLETRIDLDKPKGEIS